MYIPYQEIAENLGLEDDDVLLIASDISKLAYTTFKNKEKFNSHLFIDSFRTKLKNGTLLFPAFLDSFKSGDVFDKLKNVPEMGALSKLAFEREDFIRTSDPLHSFMVYGKNTDELAELKSNSTFGNDSVFAFLKERKAKILLIDVDLQHSFTFAHYVEENQQVSYRKYRKINYSLVNEEGEISKETIRIFEKKKGVVNTLNKLEPLFIERGAMKKFELNDSIFRLIHLDIAFELMCEEIQLNDSRKLYVFDSKQFIKSTLKTILRR